MAKTKEEVKKEVKLVPESPDWLHTIIPISEKVYKTPTNFPRVLPSEDNSSYRHHHYKLSKKISEFCEKITKLNGLVDFLFSLYPDKFLDDAVSKYIEYKEQKKKVKLAQIELVEKRSKLRKTVEVSK